MGIFSHFNLKIFFLITIPVLILEGCEYVSISSNESLAAEEKKPWSYDESSMAGASVAHKSYKNITPCVGWNVSLDETSKLKSSFQKNNAPEEIKPDIKTMMNKKTKTIKVIPSEK